MNVNICGRSVVLRSPLGGGMLTRYAHRHPAVGHTHTRSHTWRADKRRRWPDSCKSQSSDARQHLETGSCCHVAGARDGKSVMTHRGCVNAASVSHNMLAFDFLNTRSFEVLLAPFFSACGKTFQGKNFTSTLSNIVEPSGV